MNYTDEELQSIEDMAALFFSLKDIAIILEKDVEDFTAEINLEEGLAYSRYKKGWIGAEIEVRKSIMESAINGSSPAQVMILEMNNINRHV